LGLAISLEDARLHGGWLEAWGTPGQGASFRLTLPRRPGLTLTGSPLPLTPDDAVASGLSPVRTDTAAVPGAPRLGEPERVSLTDVGEPAGGPRGARWSVPTPDRGPSSEDELG
ncbi:MAG: two-component sensor histidine kinase, partial [Sciscionella sp.]